MCKSFIVSIIMPLCVISTTHCIGQAGALDPSFGIGGIVTNTIGTSFDDCYSIDNQSDGKIIAAGRATVGGLYEVALARYLPDGSPDASFSDDGVQSFSVGAGADVVYAMTILEDDRILLAGYTDDGDGFDYLIMRLLPDGTPDNTFGDNGIVIINPTDGDDILRAMHILPDNRILLAGYTGTGAEEAFGLVRLNADGTPDITFGDGGTTGFDVGTSNARAYALAVLPDNRFYVAGFGHFDGDNDMAVVRCFADGSIDASFGTGGVATVDVGGTGNDECRAVLLTGDAHILLAGFGAGVSTQDFALAKLNEDGTPDVGFGTGGLVTTDIQAFHDDVSAAVLQADGKIILCGRSGVDFGSRAEFGMARYLEDGTLDNSFGTGGIVHTAVGTGEDDPNAMLLDDEGRIILAGGTDNGPDNDFALIRYLNDETINIDPTAIAHVGIAPNPADDHVVVQCDQAGELYVYDNVGNLILTRITTGTAVTLNIASLPAGLYILTHRSASGVRIGRLEKR